MTDNGEENYALSLYYPVMKTAEWKTTSASSTIASDWNSQSFTETDWNTVTLGSASAVAGTQYFRKAFNGIPSMAAYELELNYKFGIIAYINGVEVLRDYMADGDATPSTLCSGGYEAYDYRGVIRPAAEMEGENNVLAVELHFPDLTTEYAVVFDAFMAALAPSTPITENTLCFVYPYDVTVSAADGTSPASLFNFNRMDAFMVSASALPTTVSYGLSGPRPHVNGLRVWPYAFNDEIPATFTLQGAMSASDAFTDVVVASNARGAAGSPKTFYNYFAAQPFANYRLAISSTATSGYVFGTEVQLVTCHDKLPSAITFNPSSFVLYPQFSMATIQPELSGFTNCAVEPTLPGQFEIDAASCVLRGFLLEDYPLTTFTMTATVNGQSYQGTFTLQSATCTDSLVVPFRAYGSNAYRESLSVIEVATGDVVYSVAYNAGQQDNSMDMYALCLAGDKYEIVLDSSTGAWGENSVLAVNTYISISDATCLANVRYDTTLGMPTRYTINVKWSVAPRSEWFYKLNALPADWFSADVSGWSTGAMGDFSAPNNQIQLYKKTFTVASLTDVAGFEMALRYLYGCVVYMNGHEVFRNGVSGELSVDSVSSNMYGMENYHFATLPAKSIAVGEMPAVNYLREGANTIAVALVGQADSETTTQFDCAVRLVVGSESHVSLGTTSLSDIDGSPSSLINRYYNSLVSSSSCSSNYWIISFSDGRREWFSALTLYLYYTQSDKQPRQFLVKARNTNEEWTLLKNVTDVTWSHMGEHKRFWLDNDKAWSEYIIEDISSGDPDNCAWQLSNLDFTADAAPADIPYLAYEGPLTLTKDSEMEKVYPNSEYYYDFTVSPELPAGMTIDSNSGVLSGRPSEEGSGTFTITAKQFGGGMVTVYVDISVVVCTGGKSLVSLAALTDFYGAYDSWALFAGKDTSGSAVASIDGFSVVNGLNYADWCLPHGLYTLVLKSDTRDGWTHPAGWYLAVDGGEMVFETGQVPPGVDFVTTTFSSYLPFQAGYDDWKVFNSAEAVAANWKSVRFDDSTWETKKAAELGSHASTTAYVRHEVSIPAIEDYHVLNVRVKYTGGVAAYFNGRLVARFNLDEKFDATTEALAAHDATLFSKFHIILPLAEAETGKNMMAFEIHRASGQSAIVFDATAVFGVNDCSPVLDSFSAIDASEVSGCTKEDLLDLNPTTYGNIPNTAGSYLSWTVENLEGSLFNSFALQTSTAATGYGFSVQGRWESKYAYADALTVTDQSTMDRARTTWSVPKGFAGFNQIKFVVSTPAAVAVATSAYITQYCVPSGEGACAGEDEYPAVNNGEWSVAKCPKFMSSYTYRQCVDGVLGSVTRACEYKQPANLAYPGLSSVITTVDSVSFTPTYTNFISLFEVTEGALPAGLTLDAATGEISGTATGASCTSGCSVTIKGANRDTSTSVTLSFHVIGGSFSYPVIGAGVHVTLGEAVFVEPVISGESSPFTRFEATGLPEGLSINASTGEISGTATGSAQSEVTVKGFVGDTVFLPVTFTLFVHDHSAAQPFVPAGASCPFILRMYATGGAEAGTVYLDSASSTTSLGFTRPAMEVGEVKSVFVCLPDAEYIMHSSGVDLLVLKGTSPAAIFVDGNIVNALFSTTPVCEESLDTECDVVIGEGVTLKESGAESGTVHANRDIVALDRSKTYEM